MQIFPPQRLQHPEGVYPSLSLASPQRHADLPPSATTTSRRSLPFTQSRVSTEACRSSPLSDYNIQKESTFTQSCISVEACRSSPLSDYNIQKESTFTQSRISTEACRYSSPIVLPPSQCIPSPHCTSAPQTHTQPPSRIYPPNAYLAPSANLPPTYPSQRLSSPSPPLFPSALILFCPALPTYG
jgi:hypothetical protein